MDISVNSSAERLELRLGTCLAKMDISQAQELRNQLNQVLVNALEEHPDYWKNLAARLEESRYLATTLATLNDQQLKQIIEACHQPYWLPLVRFARKEQPKLAKRLLNALGKIDYLTFTSLEEFTSQLETEPATSVAEVIIALDTLLPLFQRYCPEAIAHTKQTEPKDIKLSFNARAVVFLTQLSDLPSSNLRLILKSLTGEELGMLFSACKMLAITNFFVQLESILPEKLFLQLETKCSTSVEESELKNLLSKLNLQLKDLKKLIADKKKA